MPLQVGDNSRPELMNKTSYHYGVWMRNATYGVEHILIIPRHPTTVPYNAPNPEVMMKVCCDISCMSILYIYYVLYNYVIKGQGGIAWLLNFTFLINAQYVGQPLFPRPFPNSVSPSDYFAQEYADLKMCPWVAGIACPTDYSNFTLDDALLRLAKYYSFQLLQWRADPFMFHQANLVCRCIHAYVYNVVCFLDMLVVHWQYCVFIALCYQALPALTSCSAKKQYFCSTSQCVGRAIKKGSPTDFTLTEQLCYLPALLLLLLYRLPFSTRMPQPRC